MLITNMQSPSSGRPVANQFVIYCDGTITFQSYKTIVAEADNDTGIFKLDICAFEYSRTTSRYLKAFIEQVDRTADWSELRKSMIKTSEYDSKLFHYVFVNFN